MRECVCVSVCKYVRESSAKRIGQTDKCVRERERETYAAADRQLSPRTAQQNMLRKGKGGSSSSRATVATESTRTWQPARGTAISQQQHNSDKNNNNTNKRQQEVSLATHAVLHVPSMKAVGEGGGEGE